MNLDKCKRVILCRWSHSFSLPFGVRQGFIYYISLVPWIVDGVPLLAKWFSPFHLQPFSYLLHQQFLFVDQPTRFRPTLSLPHSARYIKCMESLLLPVELMQPWMLQDESNQSFIGLFFQCLNPWEKYGDNLSPKKRKKKLQGCWTTFHTWLKYEIRTILLNLFYIYVNSLILFIIEKIVF